MPGLAGRIFLFHGSIRPNFGLPAPWTLAVAFPLKGLHEPLLLSLLSVNRRRPFAIL